MGQLDNGWVATIVVALIGSTGTILSLIFTRRNRNVEVKGREAEIAESWQEMVTKEQERNRVLSDRLDRVEKRLDTAEREIDRLIEGVSILSNQVVELGSDPDWRYANGSRNNR